MPDQSPKQIALFGGVYSNYLALTAALTDIRNRGIADVYCLGDLGAFGPRPNRVFPLLHQHNVHVVQGNYDDSIGRGLSDCQCGYTDPADNHFAAISYQYTFNNTDPQHRPWMANLPREIRLKINDQRILLCHGSPRKTNEFLWESTTSTAFIEKLHHDHDADVICCTHTGIKWSRRAANDKLFVNVGCLGRPENDGNTNVWYAIVTVGNSSVDVEFVPVHYDHDQLANDMRAEQLPSAFIETIKTGWWTTCLEILPAKERARGRY